MLGRHNLPVYLSLHTFSGLQRQRPEISQPRTHSKSSPDIQLADIPGQQECMTNQAESMLLSPYWQSTECMKVSWLCSNL